MIKVKSFYDSDINIVDRELEQFLNDGKIHKLINVYSHAVAIDQDNFYHYVKVIYEDE